MTTNNILLAFCGMVLVAAMIYIPMVLVVIRGQQTLARVCGAAYRENDRERRDMHDLVEKLLEKNTVNPVMAMQQHGHERAERQSLDTSLQREELKSHPEQGSAFSTPVEVTDDITLAME